MAHPLEIAGDFPFSVERYIEVYFDPGFIDYLRENLDVDEYRVELLETRGNKMARTLKVAPRLELPWIVAKALGSKRISYLETSLHHRGTRVIAWNVLTSVLPEKISVAGETVLEPTPNGGCSRSMKGEIAVRFRTVGPRVEEKIVESIKNGYVSGAGLMIDYELKSRP
jgi:hypothetical protein